MTDDIYDDLSILAKIILHANIATMEQLLAAARTNENNKLGLLYNLILLKYITDADLLEKLGNYLKLPVYDLTHYQQPANLAGFVDKSYIVEHHLIPINKTGYELTVATDEPTNLNILDKLKFETGLTIKLVLASPTLIHDQIHTIKIEGSKFDLLGGSGDEKTPEKRLRLLDDAASDIAFDATMLDLLAEEVDSDMPTMASASDIDSTSVDDAKYVALSVYYATDRSLDNDMASSKEYFIGERNASNALTFGRCTVSIPREHRIGHIERPSWLRLQFSENPEKHMTILDFIIFVQDEFYTEIKSFLSGVNEDSALVFVHGYNVSFPDAILRTAQISYDLNFSGPAVCYSWPSTATLKGYLADANNARWSEPHFKEFLNDLRSRTDVKNIHIIAHSMGSRVLAGALSGVADDFSSEQVIFAAPDIDADVFKELTGTFHQKVKRITLYASSNDEALSLSRKLQGDYARAGETISGVLVYPNVDSIDATQVNTGLLGHSYYGDNRSIVSDIYHLIRQDMPPDKRFGMNEKENDSGNKYWEFRP